MSHVFEALQRAEEDGGGRAPDLTQLANVSVQLLKQVPVENTWLDQVEVLEAKPGPDARLVTFAEGEGLAAERFRLLRARLRHLQEKSQLKKIVITSGVPNDGKTLVSSNLVVSLAKHNAQRVLLLEGDLRKPVLSERFGHSGLRGISEWAQQDLPIHQFIYRFAESELFFLPAGAPTHDPLKILNSVRFVEVLNKLGSCFDWVVIDAPPLFPVADVHFWSKHADGILLVIRQGNTSKKVLQMGLKTLDGANLLGIALNDVSAAERGRYQQYYDHYRNRVTEKSGKSGKH